MYVILWLKCSPPEMGLIKKYTDLYFYKLKYTDRSVNIITINN